MKNNISSVKKMGQCCSCGICAGVCPKNAISMQISPKTGELVPHVLETDCCNCSVCLKICPGILNAKSILTDTLQDYQRRQCIHTEAYVGRIMDLELLSNCTSGGIVSELVRTLLAKSIYESAFLVNTNRYDEAAKSARTVMNTVENAKSRYVAVSHENAIRYILSHREERIILVGVGCAISGFRNFFKQYRLKSDNYLLIGLFCDRIMTYEIWKYFGDKYSLNGRLTGLDFRSKWESGWPGDVRLYFCKNSFRVGKKERIQVKNFFQNERCLYCADKLNEAADISLGDNYTGKEAVKEGSSSIVVRTAVGKKALDEIRAVSSLTPIAVEEICESQKLDKRAQNLNFAKIKYLRSGRAKIPLKDYVFLLKQLFMIKIGRSYSRMPILLRAVLKLK